MVQYQALVRWARWAEDAIGEWTGVTLATGAAVPPCAFTSGWPDQHTKHTAKQRNAAPNRGSPAR
jgi:hypothetical protein